MPSKPMPAPDAACCPAHAPATCHTWIIPWAAAPAGVDAQAARAGLHLPHLEQLLGLLRAQPERHILADAYAMPHEVALARGLGLDDGCIPWAALASASSQPCAWLLPCHWRVDAHGVYMPDPGTLALEAPQARALMDTLVDWLTQDGLQVEWHTPQRWLARGDLFGDLCCASPERAIGRDVTPWLPRGGQAPAWQRLHSEVQMLLHGHPVNLERTRQGLAPINALWPHGAGHLAGAAPVGSVQCLWDLQAPALAGDLPGWRSRWQALDADVLAALPCRVRAGQDARLVLCGERKAFVWARPQSAAGRWMLGLRRAFCGKGCPLPDALV